MYKFDSFYQAIIVSQLLWDLCFIYWDTLNPFWLGFLKHVSFFNVFYSQQLLLLRLFKLITTTILSTIWTCSLSFGNSRMTSFSFDSPYLQDIEPLNSYSSFLDNLQEGQREILNSFIGYIYCFGNLWEQSYIYFDIPMITWKRVENENIRKVKMR